MQEAGLALVAEISASPYVRHRNVVENYVQNVE
jgi:hypothetical protein